MSQKMEERRQLQSRTPACRRSAIGCAVLLLFCLAWRTDADWVDPDSPKLSRTTKALTEGDERRYRLVFSDEFEQDGRTFNDGQDPRWTAINKNDYTNDALHFYSHDNARTTNGVLNITTEQKVNSYKAFNEKTKKFYADKKYIQTGMLQSWNKFCFIGGIVEFSAKLPGDPKTGGLWPALWMMGNLARATYVGSSNYMWPFSYNKCDKRKRKSQEINACSRVNHYGLAPYQGRGAPEIDVIEAMQGNPEKLPNSHVRRPYQSTSLQIAPGVEINRPVLGERPHKRDWYGHLEYGDKNKTDLNPFFYGVTLVHKPKSYTYQADALSANLQLNSSHYQSHHVYRVEWEPPDENGTGGYIKWFTDNEFIYGVFSDSLEIMESDIPSEPMYLLMNTAVSSKWGFPAPCPDNCECECFECGNPSCACGLPAGYCGNFPASFEIDYVRVYQAVNESKHILGCSPESRPTAQFIEGHVKRYMAEDQSRPLQPIRTGGGKCSRDRNCGGSEKGTCSTAGSCSCKKGWTGPHCFAHAGFYDVDTSAPIPPFLFNNIRFPRSLIVVICLLLIGFFMSMMRSLRTKAKEAGYRKIAGAGHNEGASPGAAISMGTSYQQSAADDYALPPKQKDVTYCVIDGRLVDPS